MNGNIKSEAQVLAAIDFLATHSVSNSFKEEEFKNACGAGVVITVDQIEDEVGNAFFSEYFRSEKQLKSTKRC